MLKGLSEQGVRSLAIAGLAKNVGKTTVLNAVTQEARRLDMRVGLVSIGVDGEERDVWSIKAKPPVQVPEGTLVATASSLLDVRPGEWGILGTTPLASPLGFVTIACALRPTEVKLAGVTTVAGIHKVIQEFQQQGANLTLVDGAYDRKAAVSPLITDAGILVVGASMAKTLHELVRKLDTIIRVYTLPAVEDRTWKQAGKTALHTGRLVAIGEKGHQVLPFSSLLLKQEEWREVLVGDDWRALAVPGSLTDLALRRLMEADSPLTLLLSDPTRCFASLDTIRRYFRLGGGIQYIHPLRLAAVAVNPFAPEGYSFDPQELKKCVREVCQPIPVVDVYRDSLGEIHPFRVDGQKGGESIRVDG